MALAALKENPRLGYDRGMVARIAARLGDRKRAEDEIAQALQLSPAETKVIRCAVLTYEAFGQRDQAIQPTMLKMPPTRRRIARYCPTKTSWVGVW